MSDKVKKTELLAKKKIIAQKSNEFLARLNNSKTDFDRVCILDEMDDLLEDEKSHWLNIVQDDSLNSNPEFPDLISEASVHITELQSVQANIAKVRLSFLPGALAIQEVKIRQGELKEAKIKND